MKTKRIVALALAGVLAAGAVTPVFAAETNKEFTAVSTSEAYSKIYTAQYQSNLNLAKKVEDLQNKTKAAKGDLDTKKAALTKAELAVEDVEKQIEAQKEVIAAVQKAKQGVLNKKNELEIEFTEKFKIGSPENLDATVAKESHYWEQALKKLNDEQNAIINKAIKENKDWLEEDLRQIFSSEKEWTYTSGTNLGEYKKAVDDWKAKWHAEKADYNNAVDAQNWWNENLKELEQEASEAAKAIKAEQDKLIELNTQLDTANYYLKKAVEAEEAAEEEYVNLEAQTDAAEKELVVEKDKLVRIVNLLHPISLEMIKNETDPKLIQLASENTLAYFLGKLVEDDVYLSKATLDKLGLTESTLALYQDLLADQTDLEEPDEPTTEEPQSEEPQSEEPTSQAPNTEVPEPQKPAASDKTEGKTPNADKNDKNDKNDKKANKDKKAAPKTGDISVLAYAGSAVLAAGAFVASKKRK